MQQTGGFCVSCSNLHKNCVYLCMTKSFNSDLFIADPTLVSELGIELQTRPSPLSPHKRMTAMMEPFRYYSYLLLSSLGDAVTFTLFATLSWCTAWDNLVTFIWLFNTCQMKCNEISGEHFCNFLADVEHCRGLVERTIIVFVSLALTENKGESKKFKKRNADFIC